MAKIRESVVYYNPQLEPGREERERITRMKSVFVRMGIRIRNAGPQQALETVGFLTGVPGFQAAQEPKEELPVIPQEMLILRQFSSQRLDQLLAQLRRAGVSRIDLKAVVTEQNCGWTLYKLYEELKQEHQTMTGQKEREND